MAARLLLSTCNEKAKSRPKAAFFSAHVSLQAGHLLDGSTQLVVRAIGTGAFRRHGVDAGDGVRQQAIDTIGRTGLPGRGVTDLRRAEHASGMASATVLGYHVIGSPCGTAGGNGYGAHALAFFTHDADFTDRLQAFGDGLIGRGLSSHCPQGQDGSRRYQHFLNQIHGTPSSWLVTPADTVSRAGDSITASLPS